MSTEVIRHRESIIKEVKGRVHSFETFGTLDGPGIRFVVFLQGCPLRCVYCHNRDTWNIWGGKEYTPGQVTAEMKKYLDFFESSGGGITVTGGEPLLQPQFVAEVFKICRNMGVHTAIDTSGYSPLSRVKMLLQFTDLVILDIKHIDDKKCRNITGAGNKPVKEFAEYVSRKGIPLWLRYVLVPGLTDHEKDLGKAAEFIKTLKTVEKVEVLPYHTMGKFKWEEMGEDYPLKGVNAPSAEELSKAKEILSL